VERKIKSGIPDERFIQFVNEENTVVVDWKSVKIDVLNNNNNNNNNTSTSDIMVIIRKQKKGI
jgi:hypothetical protein